MINPTRNIEIKLAELVTQFNFEASKRYDSKFYITKIRLEKIYLNKYANKKYQFTINPFKAEVK